VEELVQLIFFAAIILFSIVARKKKRPAAQKPARPRPRAQIERDEPQPVQRQRAEAQSVLVKSKEERPEAKRGIAEELLEMLQQRIEVPEQQQTPTVPQPVEAAPESLETLEPAGGESHERFHERYIDEPQVERPYQEHEERKQRLELSRKKLQEAFILKEIIGPPKGIE
jgi:hypothetical protein